MFRLWQEAGSWFTGCVANAAYFHAAHFELRIFVSRIAESNAKVIVVLVITSLELPTSSEVRELVLTSANGTPAERCSTVARLIFCFPKGAGERVGDGKQLSEL